METYGSFGAGRPALVGSAILFTSLPFVASGHEVNKDKLLAEKKGERNDFTLIVRSEIRTGEGGTLIRTQVNNPFPVLWYRQIETKTTS